MDCFGVELAERELAGRTGVCLGGSLARVGLRFHSSPPAPPNVKVESKSCVLAVETDGGRGFRLEGMNGRKSDPPPPPPLATKPDPSETFDWARLSECGVGRSKPL